MSEIRSRLMRWAAAGLHAARFTGPLALVTAYAGRNPAFPILAYHRVNDDRDPFFPSVPTRAFEQHMAYIARTYRVLTVEDLADRLRQRRLPRRTLAITFDDGYRDTLSHAAPILARHGLPATVFLATGFIGSAEVPWFDRLAMAFKTTRASSLSLPSVETVSLASQNDRLRAMNQTLADLKRRPDDDRCRILDGILGALGGTDDRSFKNLMLTWDDVHALCGLGFSLGAHTVNHPILSRVSPQRAWTEIVGSKTMIESACGHSPRAFAFPNGRAEDYDDGTIRLVREAGFDCAVTTRFGVNGPDTSAYELRRGGPWEHDLPMFAVKLALYRVTARYTSETLVQ